MTFKVAFYLENRDIPDVDLSHPELGNPGCGGTEFLFAALPYYLAELQGGDCTPVLLANHTEALPNNFDVFEVEDTADAIRRATREGCGFFVYRPRRNAEPDVLELIDDMGLRSIGWAHVTPTERHLRLMSRAEFLRALVCVEHEQCDLSQDSAICQKLTYIVNGFDVENFRILDPPEKDPNLVAYVGALVPQKGFHLLARVWRRILDRCPNARLAVIGTGSLYRSAASLGPWGIAEQSYEEKEIIPHLADAHGRPHDSVHFLGKLGREKRQILYKAIVGVPNPTGQTENCPGSALEFQACGTAVVSGAYFGMLDTVKNGETGLLGKTDNDLISNICTLLENPERACELGQNGIRFVRDRYNYSKVTSEWIDLFSRLDQHRPPKPVRFKNNLHRHFKILIMLNRPLQLVLGKVVSWPSVGEFKRYTVRMLTRSRQQVGRWLGVSWV